MLVNEIFTIFFTILKATTYFYSLTFRFLFLRQGPQATNYATIPMIIYKIMLMDIFCDFFFFSQVRVDDSQERCEYSCVVEG